MSHRLGPGEKEYQIPVVVNENTKSDVNQKTNVTAPQTNTSHTPPSYSSTEITLTKSFNSNQVDLQSQKKQTDQKTQYKEKYDDPNSLSHAKFHTHGQNGGSPDLDLAKQIVNEQTKKRERAYASDSVKLRSVTIERDTNVNTKLYYLLSTFGLLAISFMILVLISAVIYLFSRLFFANRMQYNSQVDDQVEGDVEMADIDILSKIEEALPEHE